MDNRYNGSAYDPRQRTAVSQPVTNNHQQKRSSYREPPDPAYPQYAEDESPVIPDYAPTGQPRVYTPSAPHNDVPKSNSHRRRESQVHQVSTNAGLAATYAPQAAPTTSYEAPYAMSAAPIRTQSSSKSYSARVHAQPTVTIPPSRPYNAVPVSAGTTMSPTSPATRLDSRRSSAAASGSVSRRGSVPDRSPLQKLEGKLDSISKEEKRARVQEAEQRVAAARNAQIISQPSQSRRVSGPELPRADSSIDTSGRRNVSMPSSGFMDSTRQQWAPANQIQPQPTKPQRYYSNASNRSVDPQYAQTQAQQYDGACDPSRSSINRDSGREVQRGSSFRDRSATLERPIVQDEQHNRFSGRDATAASGSAATGLGLYGTSQSPRNEGQIHPNVGRSASRKLQKEPPQEPKRSTGNKDRDKIPDSGRQLQTDRIGHSLGKKAAQKYQEPDPVPIDAVKNPHSQGPSYEIPPQTAGGQHAREQVGFGQADPEQLAAPPGGQQRHHLRGLFHRHHDQDRRYQAPQPLDEWKRAGTATLLADDLQVDVTEQGQKQAWWEGGGSQSRRTSGARQSMNIASSYDGSYEEPAGQTSFRPPLYLKCGPLLRYTGIKRVQASVGRGTTSTAAKEIWRGSVMIVTLDQHSSYEAAPTLRLFVQPMDLLPPPPVQLNVASGQHLAPEYVDPLAGQTKMSRTGKTLYVRPVEDLEEGVDLSRIEDDTGLFEETRSPLPNTKDGRGVSLRSRIRKRDGEKLGKYREVRGVRLCAERGVTFWRFNIEVELGSQQTRVAYRINRGPAIGFWVPARGETMNMMFHSCNGFSLSVNPDQFSGPDPMWRDVLNNHQTRPFHVMIGGGDQIYNDAAMRQTTLFREWLATKNPQHKHSAEFSAEMQEELEEFYLNRYAMWFSQGLFGMANSQIPMVNMWDDHDIIDGFGSYPHHFMSTRVFTGIGAVAFKYYMLFQQQSVPDETSREEPSWLLGAAPGPYINELSRSIFLSMGKHIAFLGLDCRTERMRDEILSQETYDLIFDRCRREIIVGETKHLIVLLGVPIAYPRLNFLENILTSRVMDPIKALGRAGMLGGFVNKFDGGVEILDDLDDHWTAKHHKHERNWFIQELQELAAEKSVRITILGGDVHLAAVGQFYSRKKLGIPKDRDHRYMPNIISSAIVNTPPPELMADVINKRNKIHHLDADTDEDMIPMFTHDVDGKPRNNHHLLPRRNWCSLREYQPGSTPPPSPPPQPQAQTPPPPPGEYTRPTKPTRSLSLTRADFRPANLVRRLSRSGGKPPPAYYNNTPGFDSPHAQQQQRRPGQGHRASSLDGGILRPTDASPSYFPAQPHPQQQQQQQQPPPQDPPRPNPFHRRPTGLSEKAARKGVAWNPGEGEDDDEAGRGGHIDLTCGLDVVLNVEVSQRDPAGITTPYRLLVPALDYRGEGDVHEGGRRGRVGSLWENIKGMGRGRRGYEEPEEYGGSSGSSSGRVGVGGGDAQFEGPRISGPTMGGTTGGMRGGTAGGVPVRKQYRGDLYGAGEEFDDEGSEGSITPEESPQHGYGMGQEGRVEEKSKPGWKIWK